MDKDKLQKLCDAYNEHYVNGCVASDAESYFQAALIGRQIVEHLGKSGMVSDGFMCIYQKETQ